MTISKDLQDRMDEISAALEMMTPVEKYQLRKLSGFSNATIDHMLANNIPLTTENYVSLNWSGDKTILDLEGEDLADLQHLVEIALLRNITAGSGTTQ